MEKITKIGITCGDPNGVGLQILMQSFNSIFVKNKGVKVILFASKYLWDFYLKLLKINGLRYALIQNVEDSRNETINIIECFSSKLNIQPGKITRAAGLAAAKSLEVASDYLMLNKIDALVTMPVSKLNMHFENGYKFIGHTEYLRDKSNAHETLMILITKGLKVATVTNHVPIAKISKQITKKLVTLKLKLLISSLENDFSINKPKIAVLGLNPHMGDGGLIGKEEISIIKPVIEKFDCQGFNVSGPFSPDAFFGKLLYKNYDAVLAMYHDQGLIPFKMESFNKGVNFTAGMNYIRTSPDHGPAFDIVGTMHVNCESFLNSIFFANKIYKSRLV